MFYQDKKIKEAEADQLGLNPIGWGQYICRVSNPVGTLNITYNVYAEGKIYCYKYVFLVLFIKFRVSKEKKGT